MGLEETVENIPTETSECDPNCAWPCAVSARDRVGIPVPGRHLRAEVSDRRAESPMKGVPGCRRLAMYGTVGNCQLRSRVGGHTDATAATTASHSPCLESSVPWHQFLTTKCRGLILFTGFKLTSCSLASAWTLSTLCLRSSFSFSFSKKNIKALKPKE